MTGWATNHMVAILVVGAFLFLVAVKHGFKGVRVEM